MLNDENAIDGRLRAKAIDQEENAEHQHEAQVIEEERLRRVDRERLEHQRIERFAIPKIDAQVVDVAGCLKIDILTLPVVRTHVYERDARRKFSVVEIRLMRRICEVDLYRDHLSGLRLVKFDMDVLDLFIQVVDLEKMVRSRYAIRFTLCFSEGEFIVERNRLVSARAIMIDVEEKYFKKQRNQHDNEHIARKLQAFADLLTMSVYVVFKIHCDSL